MAVTFTSVTVKAVNGNGAFKEVYADVAISGTVTAGGDAPTAAQLNTLGITGGNTPVLTVEFLSHGLAIPVWNYSTSKLQFFTAPAAPGAAVVMIEAVGATVTGTLRVIVRSQGAPGPAGPAH